MSTEDETGTTIRRLERRIEDLETRLGNLTVRAACIVVAALLIAGSVIPFGYGTERGEPFNPSVVSLPWRMIGAAAAADGDSSGPEVTFGILMIAGFIGLTVVVLAMLCTLVIIWGRDGGDGALKFAKVLRVLGIIGTIAVLIFTLVFMGGGPAADGPGWGGLLLLVGVLGYAVLLSERVRGLWLRSPHR